MARAGFQRCATSGKPPQPPSRGAELWLSRPVSQQLEGSQERLLPTLPAPHSHPWPRAAAPPKDHPPSPSLPAPPVGRGSPGCRVPSRGGGLEFIPRRSLLGRQRFLPSTSAIAIEWRFSFMKTSSPSSAENKSTYSCAKAVPAPATWLLQLLRIAKIGITRTPRSVFQPGFLEATTPPTSNRKRKKCAWWRGTGRGWLWLRATSPTD